MIRYATTADLETWTGQPADDDAHVLIGKASVLVRAATRCDLYDATPNGMPTDNDLYEAVRDACCEQVAVWQRAQTTVAEARTAGGVVTSTGIDGASITFDTTATQAASAQLPENTITLCHEATLILRNAGLASAGVQ